MAKKKSKSVRSEVVVSGSKTSIEVATCTAASVASDPYLGYKLRVLLHDLRNMPGDRSCEARTLSTTDELYLSQPYFTPDEALKIKNAIVDHKITPFTYEEEVDCEDFDEEEEEEEVDSARSLPRTVEETIHSRMASFFEKRRVSGDARPCGPHTMAPLYQAVFGVGKDELMDKKFLGRLRMKGLEDNEDLVRKQVMDVVGKGKSTK